MRMAALGGVRVSVAEIGRRLMGMTEQLLRSQAWIRRTVADIVRRRRAAQGR